MERQIGSICKRDEGLKYRGDGETDRTEARQREREGGREIRDKNSEG